MENQNKQQKTLIFLSKLIQFSSTAVGIDRFCRISSFSLKGSKHLLQKHNNKEKGLFISQETKQKSIRAIDESNNQLGQIRRFLRTKRCQFAYCRLMQNLEIYQNTKQFKQLSQLEQFQCLYNIILFAYFVFTDVHDFIGLLSTFKVLENQQLNQAIRMRGTKFYFIECIGWNIYYTLEYIKITRKINKQKNILPQKELEQLINRQKCLRFSILKYYLDCIVSYSYINPSIMSFGKIIIIGLITSIISIKQLWPQKHDDSNLPKFLRQK